MTFVIKVQYPDDTGSSITRQDTPDSNLRRVFRIWRQGEMQFRPISELVMHLRLSLLHFDDISSIKAQQDALDEILARYIRKKAIREQHNQSDMQDLIVVLRLSLMRTLWERRGFLDLPYIDSVIKQVIKDFKNKHQTTIKQEHWGILANMCWDEINHAQRYEPEEEQDPVDIDIEDDDIDAWINSEL